MSLKAKVRNNGNLFQSNVCTFVGDLAAVRIIVVSVLNSKVSTRRELTVIGPIWPNLTKIMSKRAKIGPNYKLKSVTVLLFFSTRPFFHPVLNQQKTLQSADKLRLQPGWYRDDKISTCILFDKEHS